MLSGWARAAGGGAGSGGAWLLLLLLLLLLIRLPATAVIVGAAAFVHSARHLCAERCQTWHDALRRSAWHDCTHA